VCAVAGHDCQVVEQSDSRDLFVDFVFCMRCTGCGQNRAVFGFGTVALFASTFFQGPDQAVVNAAN
jgi:hypothetical protein